MMNETEDNFKSGTALVIHISDDPLKTGLSADDDELRLEAEGLVRAIHMDPVHTEDVRLRKIDSGHFFSSGILDRIRDLCDAYKPEIVFVNHSLSPVQQRNIERALQVKIIDRTGLIIEIFGARAQTHEGRIQVELAALDYQRSRLVRSWTHLERQRGGAGFMGGPGETQIELDRRIINDRMAQLKKDLEKVRKTRALAKRSRERVPFPIVSLVGYTNAGKSTLFNRLTGASVFAEDLPFATLDPTMRQIEVEGGWKAILADTVGFIHNLPTMLVEAFRATLEQVQDADILIHVVDIASNGWEAQYHDVIEVLANLDIEYETDPRIIEVCNKTDLFGDDNAELLSRLRRMRSIGGRKPVALSAITGEGMTDLEKKIATHLTEKVIRCIYRIPVADGQAMAWLHANSHIRNMTTHDLDIEVVTDLMPEDRSRFEHHFSYHAKTA